MVTAAIATVDDELATSPLQVLSAAIRQGASPESVTQLSELVRSWKETMAREAFGNAVATFQSQCPPIVKKRDADRYKFAAYEDIWHVVHPFLAELNISVSFSSPRVEGAYYCCVCTLRVAGYSEAYPFTAPMPNTAALAGKMFLTEPQAFGVVLSYFKRYALCAALNIVVVGEDSDAAIAQMTADGITEEQARELGELLKKRGTKWDDFLAWVSAREHRKVERLSEMSLDSYKVAKAEAEATLEKRAAAKKGGK